MHNRHKRFTLPQKLIAGAIATGLLATGIGTAWAGMGSGGTGASGSSGIGPNGDLLYVYDNTRTETHEQGWGDDSIAYTINHLRQSGYPIPEAGYQLYDDIYSTCRDAIQNAINDKSDGPADKARVVGLAATLGQTNTLVSWGTNPTDFRNRFNNNWNYIASDGMQNDLTGWGDDWVNRLNQKFQDQITATGQLYPTGVSMVCVAVNNNQPVPQSYDLSITTNQQAPKTLTIGDTTPVRDMIHASNNGSQIREKLTAKVILHAELPQGSYVPSANPVSKTVTISNQGDTASPDFTPSDFGWDFWPEGTYWFDIQIAKQGKMANAVDTADREPAETFTLTATPPPAPHKTVSQGVSADSMTNTTRIVSGTGVGGFEMRFTDTISPNGVAYTVTNMRVTDLTAKSDVSDQFDMRWNQQDNTVTAYRSADHGLMPANHDYELSFDVTVTTPANYQRIQDEASVAWNHNPAVETNPQEFPTWQPKPDKAWVRFDKTTNKWQTVIDPDHTNTVGADGFTFMDGDKVGSVVNGTIAAHLVEAPESLTLTDDYSNADYVWDTVKNVKDMRVFEVDATTDRHSSVADIINKGRDVTGQWTVSIDKNTHTITAASSKQYAQAQQNLPQPKQLTVLAPGVVNFANGKGGSSSAQRFR